MIDLKMKYVAVLKSGNVLYCHAQKVNPPIWLMFRSDTGLTMYLYTPYRNYLAIF